MKIALVHDFFCNLGGSDQVVATLHQIYPQAPVFTLLVSERSKDAEMLLKLTDALEDDDDVSKVFSNFDIDQDTLAAVSG